MLNFSHSLLVQTPLEVFMTTVVGRWIRVGSVDSPWRVYLVCWNVPDSRVRQRNAMSRSSHLYVACKIFDQQKVCLIAWSFPSEALDHLILMGQRSNCSCLFMILWFSQFTGYLDPLIGSHKGLWLLDSILIPVANASTHDLASYPGSCPPRAWVRGYTWL